MDCITRAIEGLTFEICKDTTGIILKQGDRSATLTHADLRSVDTLRVILDVNFDIDVKDPRSFRIADTLAHDSFIESILKEAELAYEEYVFCLEYIDGECAGEYIVANARGVFLRSERPDRNKKIRPFEHQVSSLKVLKIKDVEFKGLTVNLGSKFVKIETPNGPLTGSIDEIAILVESVYGLKRPNEFKFLLNQSFTKEAGFYAIGPWFDGKQLAIATESLYNPAWKKVTEYRLPPEVAKEKKVEALRRILATVQSYRRPDIVTWVLSYGLMANFAHWFRQHYGYFPNSIIIGRRQTGKTSLLALVQYLFWGNNPLPPIRPKTEAQLRQLLSQSTLVIPIEDWRELESDSSQIDDMISLLHASAQTFVLRRVTTSNKDVNGVYLALSAVLGDANYNKDIDTDALDKLIFITIDKDEGVDVKKAEETNALLKNELRSDFELHNVLHSLGIELLQIAAQKLTSMQLAKDRTAFLSSVINVGYQSWLELFRMYGISLRATVNGVNDFPYPTLETSTGETEEDLELAFYNFISEKRNECMKQYGKVPDSKYDLLNCGFFFDGSDVIISYRFIKEFITWLEDKGFHARGVERVKKELGLARTNFTINGTTYYLYKKHFPAPAE